jgi:hypothetical protein
LDSSGLGALLEKTGLVGHHNTARVSEMVQHIAAQVIPHPVGVPAVEVQQTLHTVRGEITGLLGDRPRILALGAREQTQHIQAGTATRVRLREPARDQREHVPKPRPPPCQAIVSDHLRRDRHVLLQAQHTPKLITRRRTP